jgi:hypothetical protein
MRSSAPGRRRGVGGGPAQDGAGRRARGRTRRGLPGLRAQARRPRSSRAILLCEQANPACSVREAFSTTTSLWYPSVEKPVQLSAGPPAAAAARRPARPQAPGGTAGLLRARRPARAARRPGKFAHAAHFTLRCGRALPGGRWQRPAVALVADLPAGRLSLEQAETLWHEMGHALHSLLSRTHFQHLSGARRPSRPCRAAAAGRGGLLPRVGACRAGRQAGAGWQRGIWRN